MIPYRPRRVSLRFRIDRAVLPASLTATMAWGVGTARDGREFVQDIRCGARVTAPCEVRGTYAWVSAGFLHTCGISADTVAYCWGDGRSGALGDGKLGVRATPARVAGGIRFVEVRAGGNYSCGRSVDSAVYCWGRSQAVPTYPRVSAVPVRIAGAERVTALAAGRRHACALTRQNTAWCWGFNVDGETGNGTSGVAASMTSEPTLVVGDLTFSAISAGLDFTCALTLDGNPYCWGSNVDRVLGDSAPERCGNVAPTPCSSVPTRINTTLRFVQIAAGSSHVCGSTLRGDVYCWGSNAGGQLGSLGPQHSGRYSSPRAVSIPSMDGVAALVSGGSHSCVLGTNGALYCWGSNAVAQLGAARNYDVEYAPVRSQARLAFILASAGAYHTCGLTRHGNLYCWGDHQSGALGRGP